MVYINAIGLQERAQGMAKKKFRKGFRKNKTTKHPAYTYSKKDGKYQYISVTHSDNYNEKPTIPLHKNPNPKDDKKAYILPNPYEDDIKNFSRGYNDWKIHKKDKRKFNKVMKKTISKK